MAGVLLRYGDKANVNVAEFVCDSTSEVNSLPTTTQHGTGIFAEYKHTVPMGSTCIVGNQDGAVLVYMLYGFGWKNMGEV
ncbi:hypothetical protein [Kineothrix sedimenti]|uniref:Uncharacterized protein n=1 Tax=Kineothrix sedimenti TaxID=3123317 RepID=A0ABZ3EZZ9_9FIRM